MGWRSLKKCVAVFLSSAAAVLVLSAGAWVVYTYPPAEHSFYPRCVFKASTGYECPGCGSTRAAHHLLHGRVGEAFRLNPMLFVIGAVALCAIPSLARRRIPDFLSRPWFGWAALVAVTTYWIVRNTAIYPF